MWIHVHQIILTSNGITWVLSQYESFFSFPMYTYIFDTDFSNKWSDTRRSFQCIGTSIYDEEIFLYCASEWKFVCYSNNREVYIWWCDEIVHEDFCVVNTHSKQPVYHLKPRIKKYLLFGAFTNFQLVLGFLYDSYFQF